jgi:hypothetical protein
MILPRVCVFFLSVCCTGKVTTPRENISKKEQIYSFQRTDKIMTFRKRFSLKADNENVAKIQGQHPVSCSVCRLEGFRIDRYKCLICNDYDQCAQCFEKRLYTKHHLPGKTIFV